MDDNASQQQPPMNGNDELAKALSDSTLHFEETPGPAGEADSTPPSLDPAPQMGDPLAGMSMPPLADEQPAENPPPPPPAPAPADEPHEEPAADEHHGDELPSVHHSHEKVHHAAAVHEDKKEHDKPEEPAPAPAAPAWDANSAPDMKMPGTGDPALDKVKASALEELRPLVGKLSLPAEEKFDTLLLIIRSTDDQSLLDEAHAAAKEITDETKRAQALLDIIKEVDYFSQKH